jgi:hypothetical protein
MYFLKAKTSYISEREGVQTSLLGASKGGSVELLLGTRQIYREHEVPYFFSVDFIQFCYF